MSNLNLDPLHLEDLRKSGLSDGTIKDAGIYTVPRDQINKIFGWDIPIDSLLAFPYQGNGFVRYKLFPPYKKKEETRAQKYYQKPDTPPHLYFPPDFDRTAETILITEGEKKALKACQEGLNCFASGGIWNFAVKDGKGKSQLIDAFNSIEWVDRKVELVPDSDFHKKLEVKHAVYRLGTMLEQRGANVSVVCLPISESVGKLDDYLCKHSVDEFEKLKRVPLSHKLFSEAKKQEKNAEKQLEKQPEKKPIVEDVEPWETPVNGYELFKTLYDVIKKHVVLDHHSLVACTLWTILTYCYNSFRILPLLAISSPEKRCGKTTLLETLGGLANKPLLASSITPSAIFRTIEKCSPCLLIDEADTFIKDNDELRGILNSGHTTKSAFVIRTNTETLEPERFSTWGPKAVSLIGALPDTLSDRSIAIRMERKIVSERVKRVSLDFDEGHLVLRRMCQRWSNDNTESLKNAKPSMPETGNDRATDNWLPLICIADIAGQEWSEGSRNTMLAIEKVSANDTTTQILLKDIRIIFAASDKIFSKELVEKLIQIEDHLWGDWRRGKPITQSGLARLLKPFGIFSKTIRIDENTSKGYALEQFLDTFNRYLPTVPPIQSVTTSQPASVKDFIAFQSVTQEDDVTVVNRIKPKLVNDCDVVTVENTEKGVNRVLKTEKQGLVSLDIINSITLAGKNTQPIINVEEFLG
jgi:putative DNA primase/helicase